MTQLSSYRSSALVIGQNIGDSAINRISQLPTYLFAQSDNRTVAQGVLNNNNYLRIGMGFHSGVVFRLAISKHAPLPSWIPGVVRGTLHFNLWRF